jgi:hypothetical protein
MASEWDSLLIEDKKIRNVVVEGIPIGYEFYIHGVNYRGIYLSCIEKIEVKIDGKLIAEEDEVFVLNGKQFLFAQLPELFKEYWPSNGGAVIRIYDNQGLANGSAHEVDVLLDSHMPFGVSRDDLMQSSVHGTKRLTVE